jgi:2'-hydroxyisoflavone reductase
MERREFIKTTVSAGVFLSMSPLLSCGSQKKLKILVLGGTFFVGPAIVSAALQNDHSVTLFNRGITNPSLFPNLDLIKGDRELGMETYRPVKDEDWDVVIDVWPEKSKLVDEATAALKNNAKHYIFISSIAVYNNFQQAGLNEKDEVVSLKLDKNEWSYPEEKLAAELFVKERFKNNHTILRGGPIKGWRDPAVDILYWCLKLNRDDTIIAPGSGLDHLQFIDVKDVGKFAIMAAEHKFSGIYNCTGPGKEPLLWKDFLFRAKKQFNSNTNLIWASEEFLIKNSVSSFSDLPLWTPLSEDAFMQISNDKLVKSGFEFTPLESTLADCMNWFSNNINKEIEYGTDSVGIGLSRIKEMELIDKLKGK